MIDILKIKGMVNIKRYDKGILDGEWNFENLITNAGYLQLKKMIGGDSGGINRLGLGTNNTPPQITDTALYNKIALVNINRDYSIENKIKFLAVVPEGTFTYTVSYLEGGLIYKEGIKEYLITRLIFDSPIFQKSTNSLSISYELILL